MKSLAKRIFLFLLLNAAIILTVSVLLNIFDVKPYLAKSGIDYQALLVFCLIWGMAGALISLSLSRLMAKWMMGVEVIDPDTTQTEERQLLQIVGQLVKRSGLPRMPEVGIYESEEVNAFATGPTKSRALVAVSSGLLKRMNWVEVEGVLGHEISHVANGDMVTLTLLQGVVNAFVMFFARVLAYAVTRIGKQKENTSTSPFLFNILVFVFEICFMILGMMVIAAFSRFREFRADAGGARLAGAPAMIQALTKLQTVSTIEDPRAQNSSFQAFKISTKPGILRLFATHPPLEDRIARLQGQKV
jgi:heat shock protein HtpX